jgi:outer membrane protein TolC
MRKFVVASLLVAAASAGCSRAYYRQRAEQEAQAVLAEKSQDHRWSLGGYRLDPDPRSRFVDPEPPDEPPMPPDDPAADVLSPTPQDSDCVALDRTEGIGYMELIPLWEPDENRPTEIMPASYDVGGDALSERGVSGQRGSGQRDPLLGQDARIGVLNAENTHELALINSRDYQARKESLFLAALDVTLERYAFAPQFFVTQQAIYERIGRDLPGGDPDTGIPSHLTFAPGDRGNVVAPGQSEGSEATDGQTVEPFTGRGPLQGSGIGVGKLFACGGAMLVRFANETVLEFAGPFKGDRSQSAIGLDFVQPLLQGGGRAVTLEPLTQAERNLLYEVRSYARFQREFYVSVLTGADLEQEDRLDDRQESDDDDRRRRRVGLLPLIEQLQVLRNEEQNLALLDEYERRFAAFQRAGEVSLIQLDQVRQDVALARSRVARARQRYFNNLDRFKLQIGLPTNLPMVLDESFLQHFVLDPAECRLPKLPEKLTDLPYAPDAAVATAMENRLDLMNARALLVDHWRKIAVSANGLLGVLDLEYQGRWFTPDPFVSSRPLDFSVRRSQHRATLKTELPLVRKEERNVYRTTLIEYQLARRRLMEAEDSVRLEVQTSLRDLYRAREQFEIQRSAVTLACRRVDQTKRVLELPPPPGERRELGTNSARDLLEAQQDLVDAQNDLVQAWVDYQSSYLELLRDLEILDTTDLRTLTHAILHPAIDTVPPTSHSSRPSRAQQPHSESGAGDRHPDAARRLGSTELEPAGS